MHLLQAGVDLSSIALWLGHVNPGTTHAYVEADLARKEPIWAFSLYLRSFRILLVAPAGSAISWQICAGWLALLQKKLIILIMFTLAATWG